MHNNAGATVRAGASIRWDYVSSAACPLPLGQRTDGLGAGRVQAGEALLVRVGDPNHSYDSLELASGDTVGLRSDDQFVAVAGSRQALRGFVGWHAYIFTGRWPITWDGRPGQLEALA